MHLVLILIVILAVFFGPQWWASYILKKHQKPRMDFAGNGEEFARHLIDKLHLASVSVETTDQGDHYDPTHKAVRLNESNYNQKSLTAIVTAAHEVGHALQDKHDYSPLHYRTRLATIAFHAERAGALLIYAIPVVAALTRVPHAGLLLLVLGIGVMSLSSIVHFITLPVEFDASFNRALPILEAGGYLNSTDLISARRILLACALTYVAASLAGLLNIWRWITIFRR